MRIFCHNVSREPSRVHTQLEIVDFSLVLQHFGNVTQTVPDGCRGACAGALRGDCRFPLENNTFLCAVSGQAEREEELGEPKCGFPQQIMISRSQMCHGQTRKRRNRRRRPDAAAPADLAGRSVLSSNASLKRSMSLKRIDEV